MNSVFYNRSMCLSCRIKKMWVFFFCEFKHSSFLCRFQMYKSIISSYILFPNNEQKSNLYTKKLYKSCCQITFQIYAFLVMIVRKNKKICLSRV